MAKAGIKLMDMVADKRMKTIPMTEDASKQYDLVCKEVDHLAEITPGHNWAFMSDDFADEVCKTSFLAGAAVTVGIVIGIGATVVLYRRFKPKLKTE